MSRFKAPLVRAALLAIVVSGSFLAIEVLPASAADGAKPVNLALFNPIQLVPEDQSVKGFRFSLLYGRNYDMEGLDLSLVGVNAALSTEPRT